MSLLLPSRSPTAASMIWMTIDPGLSGTGYAVFDKRRLIIYGNLYSKQKTFKAKARELSRRLAFIERDRGSISVWCEWPSNFMGSKKGIAALHSNSLLKLSFLIGQICARIHGVNLLPVQQWKGQLPKEVTRARAERFFGMKGFKSHAADAVGMGQYIIENKLI